MESALPYFAVTRVLLAAAAALRGSFAGTAINAKVKKIAATQRLIAMRRIGSSENAAYYRESGREAYTELWYRASAWNLVESGGLRSRRMQSEHSRSGTTLCVLMYRRTSHSTVGPPTSDSGIATQMRSRNGTHAVYSSRRATMGSMVAARHAGTTQAATATRTSSVAAASSVAGSLELPLDQVVITPLRETLRIKPAAIPMASMIVVEASTRRTMLARGAPRAMRMPTSCVRCVTA